jgi:hypothetical protein
MKKIIYLLFIFLISLILYSCGGECKNNNCCPPSGCKKSVNDYKGFNIDFLICRQPDINTFKNKIEELIVLPKNDNNDYRDVACENIYIFNDFNFYRIDMDDNILDNINYKETRKKSSSSSEDFCTIAENINSLITDYSLNDTLFTQTPTRYDIIIKNLDEFQTRNRRKTFFVVDEYNRLPSTYNGFHVIKNTDNIFDTLYNYMMNVKSYDFVLIYNPPKELNDTSTIISNASNNSTAPSDNCSKVPLPKNRNISFDQNNKSFKWEYEMPAIYTVTITVNKKQFVDTIKNRSYVLTKAEIDGIGKNEFKVRVKALVNFNQTYCEVGFNELICKLTHEEAATNDNIILSFVEKTGSFNWNVNKNVEFQISESATFSSLLLFSKSENDNCFPSDPLECDAIDNYARYARYYFRIKVNNSYSNLIGPLRMSCGENIPDPCNLHLGGRRSCMFIKSN